MAETNQFLLDLTPFEGPTEVQFTLFREAAFNNSAGYYQVLDAEGSIDVDGDGNPDLQPGDEGYAEAAFVNASITLTTPNLQETVVTETLAGGFLYAPFISVNSDPNRLYLPFAAANPERFQVSEDGTLLFEDAGDNDFNDLTVNFEVSGDGGTPTVPPNDNFVDRTPITGPSSGGSSTENGSNVGATGEVGEPDQSGELTSVWWTWTAPSTGSFQIDTNGSSFDTFLSVFTGDSLDALTPVGTDDNSGTDGQDSLLQIDAVEGQTYQIAVDGVDGATGDVILNITDLSGDGGETGTPPPNDNFEDRTPIPNGLPATENASNVDATNETGEPNPNPDQSGDVNSIWWTWTAPKDGTFQIDTNGSDFDTLLSVFTGSELGNLNLVSTDDNSGTDGQDSLVLINAREGQEFQIAVDGANGETGNVVLNIEEVIPFIPNPHTNINQDLFGDIVSGNSQAGSTEWLLLDGEKIVGNVPVGFTAPAGWEVAGVGDFDGDGIEDDLFWENNGGQGFAIWNLDQNGNLTGGNANFELPSLPGGVSAENLIFGGVGNFDTDAFQDDLIWYDPVTQNSVIIFTEDGTATGTELLNEQPFGGGWEIVGVGNFERADREDDLLWRNTETGINAIWFLDVNLAVESEFTTPVEVLSWEVRGVTDLDGDFIANDILWHNTDSGQVNFWFMEGTGLVGGEASVTTVIAPNYVVV
jgi:hypothetical protein